MLGVGLCGYYLVILYEVSYWVVLVCIVGDGLQVGNFIYVFLVVVYFNFDQCCYQVCDGVLVSVIDMMCGWCRLVLGCFDYVVNLVCDVFVCFKNFVCSDYDFIDQWFDCIYVELYGE